MCACLSVSVCAGARACAHTNCIVIWNTHVTFAVSRSRRECVWCMRSSKGAVGGVIECVMHIRCRRARTHTHACLQCVTARILFFLGSSRACFCRTPWPLCIASCRQQQLSMPSLRFSAFSTASRALVFLGERVVVAISQRLLRLHAVMSIRLRATIYILIPSHVGSIYRRVCCVVSGLDHCSDVVCFGQVNQCVCLQVSTSLHSSLLLNSLPFIVTRSIEVTTRTRVSLPCILLSLSLSLSRLVCPIQWPCP